MKRMIGILLLLLAVCVSASALAAKADFVATAADSAYHAEHLKNYHIGYDDMKCTGNYLKVRTQASESAKVLGHLERADGFELMAIRGTMAQICVRSAASSSPDSWEGLTGWVNADYLQCYCSASEYFNRTPRETDKSLERYIGTQSLICTTSNLRVRSEPKYGDIIGHIEREDRFVLRDLDNGWAYIQVTYSAETSKDSWEGLEGWVSADYLTVNGGKATRQPAVRPTPIPTSRPVRALWKQAYLNYLNNRLESGDDVRFALIYVDEDDIPELVFTTGIEAEGCVILTYSTRGVSELVTQRCHFTYQEGKNLLLNSDGHMDYYYDHVYTIRNGAWSEIAGGEYYGYNGGWSEAQGRYICKTYIWKNRRVSMNEYLRSLGNIYNEKTAKEPAYNYSYAQIVRELSR